MSLRQLKTKLTIADVHVDDLSDAFILLVEEALKPSGGNAQWGDEGYYFAEAGEFVSLSSLKCARLDRSNFSIEMG